MNSEKEALPRATPKARRLAKSRGLDLATLFGTGNGGAILARDVPERKAKRATSLATRMADYYGMSIGDFGEGTVRKADIEARLAELAETPQGTPLPSRRLALNRQLLESLAKTAPYTLFACPRSDVLAQNAKQAKSLSPVGITLTDLLVYVLSRVLVDFGKFNAHLVDSKVLMHADAHVSLAVATPDGVIAPVIRQANSLSLSMIAQERSRLISAIASKSLTPDDLSGGTFTLSNLGRSAVTYFTPILNYPQTAILGVGTSEIRPVFDADGNVVPASFTYLSLTVDHCLVDGKDAAEFLEAVSQAFCWPLAAYTI